MKLQTSRVGSFSLFSGTIGCFDTYFITHLLSCFKHFFISAHMIRFEENCEVVNYFCQVCCVNKLLVLQYFEAYLRHTEYVKTKIVFLGLYFSYIEHL